MFVARAALLWAILEGSDAFSPSKPDWGFSLSLQSSMAGIEKPKQEEKNSDLEKSIDVSVPYDATVLLEFEASDQSLSYEDFKKKYLNDAVASVIAKQPVNLSVPYEATIQLAFEASDRSISYEEFKPKYLAKSVAEVIAKQDGEKDAYESDEAKEVKEVVALKEIDDVKKENEEDPIVYYQRKPLEQKDIYLWLPKSASARAEADGVRKEGEKTSVLKIEAKPSLKDEVKTNSESEGLFAPAVLLTKEIIGITELNKLRGKIIKMHSDVIGGFTETAQSNFGNQVLKVLFTLADKNGDGTIDEKELTVALKALGFDFLKEKEIAQIFKRADGDKNGSLDFEEWSKAAPPTLKKNLIKLAKKNGHDLGFLAK